MAEPLTDARRAIWRAIRQWPATKDAFARQFDFESESACIPKIGPSPSDLPCLAIFPTQVDPKWWVYSTQQWTYQIRAQVWTADWVLPQCEALARHVIEAIFQAGETAPYVEVQIGRLPMLGPINIRATEVVDEEGEDEPMKVTVAEVSFLLNIERDPLGRP